MDDLIFWKGIWIGDKCPHEDCSGLAETHDPGGNESHQLRCTERPRDHMVQISADRHAQLNLEARGRCGSN